VFRLSQASTNGLQLGTQYPVDRSDGGSRTGKSALAPASIGMGSMGLLLGEWSSWKPRNPAFATLRAYLLPGVVLPLRLDRRQAPWSFAGPNKPDLTQKLFDVTRLAAASQLPLPRCAEPHRRISCCSHLPRSLDRSLDDTRSRDHTRGPRLSSPPSPTVARGSRKSNRSQSQPRPGHCVLDRRALVADRAPVLCAKE